MTDYAPPTDGECADGSSECSVHWPCCQCPHEKHGRGAVYGMCLSCRSVEVEIFEVIGYRDLSHIGEHPRYPVGYGCEVCS